MGGVQQPGNGGDDLRPGKFGDHSSNDRLLTLDTTPIGRGGIGAPAQPVGGDLPVARAGEGEGVRAVEANAARLGDRQFGLHVPSHGRQDEVDAAGRIDGVGEGGEVQSDLVLGAHAGQGGHVVDEGLHTTDVVGRVDATTSRDDVGVTGDGDDHDAAGRGVGQDEHDGVGQTVTHTGPSTADAEAVTIALVETLGTDGEHQHRCERGIRDHLGRWRGRGGTDRVETRDGRDLAGHPPAVTDDAGSDEDGDERHSDDEATKHGTTVSRPDRRAHGTGNQNRPGVGRLRCSLPAAATSPAAANASRALLGSIS